VTPCESTYANIGVVGTGTVKLTDTDEVSSVASELAANVRDISSVWGSGSGLGCEPGLGLLLDTNNWRDVDQLIVRAGEFLHDRDLSLQVSISVGGIPVPH